MVRICEHTQTDAQEQIRVRFEDNIDNDENMAKRKARSDGGSDAGGSKRSRSEKAELGQNTTHPPTNT